MHRTPMRSLRSACCLVPLWLTACGSDPAGKPTPEGPGATGVPIDLPVALTPTERNNSVRDLFGFPDDGDDWPAPPAIADRFSSPAESLGGVFAPAVQPPPWPVELPAEVGVHGFDGMVDGQEPSAYSVEAWQQATLHFAPYALVSAAFLACEDWESASEDTRETCGWNSVSRFAFRVWRRPLERAETDRLRALWDAQLAAGTAEEAVVITVSSLLLSPRFTHRIEEGAIGSGSGHTRNLTAFELASRLSYFLWDTMPDTDLFRAADEGNLETEADIRAQVQRMLADPKARETAARFHHSWLGTDAVLGIAPSRAAHGPRFGISAEQPGSSDCDLEWPTILGPVRHALYAELSLTVADSLFDGPGTLTDLFTTDVGYISTQSKPVHGTVTVDTSADTVPWPYTAVAASLPVSGTLQMTRVTYAADERAGILALPAVLAVGAYPVHPGPIPRGVNILERVLCTELGDPPEGAEGALPADVPEAEQTNRSRTEVATAGDSCAGCHSRINPLGFAFEHYDALGAWRATDNDLPVDASVEVLIDGTTESIADAMALGAALADSTDARSCYALHTVRSATGIDWDETDPHITPLIEGFIADDHIPSLIEEVATSTIFRTIELVEEN